MQKHLLSMLIRLGPRPLVEHLAKREVDQRFLKMIGWLPSLCITRGEVSKGDQGFVPIQKMAEDAIQLIGAEIRALIPFLSTEQQELITAQLDAFNTLLTSPEPEGDNK